MIGGIVVDLWRWEPTHLSVVVKDDHFVCVKLEKTDNSLAISFGDSLWWQGGIALWTPRDKSIFDVRIPKIGNSFAVEESRCPERIAFVNNP